MTTRPGLELTPIERNGASQGLRETPPSVVNDIAQATAELYARVGFEPPWIGYLARSDGELVGTCGFKSPPIDGRVELAYFTFPAFEGRGIATAMARELVRIARQRDATVAIAAQTLPERNASHRVLEKLGFTHVATLEHPEDGLVWEWRAPSA